MIGEMIVVLIPWIFIAYYIRKKNKQFDNMVRILLNMSDAIEKGNELQETMSKYQSTMGEAIVFVLKTLRGEK